MRFNKYSTGKVSLSARDGLRILNGDGEEVCGIVGDHDFFKHIEMLARVAAADCKKEA